MRLTRTHKDTVNDLTKHITNDSVKKRTQEFLTKTLAELDMIDSLDDTYQMTNQEFTISMKELDDREQKRIAAICLDDDELEEATHPIVEEVKPINERHCYGYTALMQAVVDHDIQTLKNCLHLGADKNIADNGGNTPIEKAIKLGYQDIVVLLT